MSWEKGVKSEGGVEFSIPRDSEESEGDPFFYLFSPRMEEEDEMER